MIGRRRMLVMQQQQHQQQHWPGTANSLDTRRSPHWMGSDAGTKDWHSVSCRSPMFVRRAAPLLKHEGGWTIEDSSTLKGLHALQDSVTFLVAVGRIHKSRLLNEMLALPNQGFPNDTSRHGGSAGIYVWGQPVNLGVATRRYAIVADANYTPTFDDKAAELHGVFMRLASLILVIGNVNEVRSIIASFAPYKNQNPALMILFEHMKHPKGELGGAEIDAILGPSVAAGHFAKKAGFAMPPLTADNRVAELRAALLAIFSKLTVAEKFYSSGSAFFNALQTVHSAIRKPLLSRLPLTDGMDGTDTRWSAVAAKAFDLVLGKDDKRKRRVKKTPSAAALSSGLSKGIRSCCPSLDASVVDSVARTLTARILEAHSARIIASLTPLQSDLEATTKSNGTVEVWIKKNLLPLWRDRLIKERLNAAEFQHENSRLKEALQLQTAELKRLSLNDLQREDLQTRAKSAEERVHSLSKQNDSLLQQLTISKPSRRHLANLRNDIRQLSQQLNMANAEGGSPVLSPSSEVRRLHELLLQAHTSRDQIRSALSSTQVQLECRLRDCHALQEKVEQLERQLLAADHREAKTARKNSLLLRMWQQQQPPPGTMMALDELPLPSKRSLDGEEEES